MENIYANGEAVFEAKSAFLCTAAAEVGEVGEDPLRGGGGGTRSGPQSLPRSVKKLAKGERSIGGGIGCAMLCRKLARPPDRSGRETDMRSSYAAN